MQFTEEWRKVDIHLTGCSLNFPRWPQHNEMRRVQPRGNSNLTSQVNIMYKFLKTIGAATKQTNFTESIYSSKFFLKNYFVFSFRPAVVQNKRTRNPWKIGEFLLVWFGQRTNDFIDWIKMIIIAVHFDRVSLSGSCGNKTSRLLNEVSCKGCQHQVSASLKAH